VVLRFNFPVNCLPFGVIRKITSPIAAAIKIGFQLMGILAGCGESPGTVGNTDAGALGNIAGDPGAPGTLCAVGCT
jgi:hypothetical protein